MKSLHACLAGMLLAGSVWAQTTMFTYQGRLADGGSPANGTYDLRFSLHDADSGGLQYGTIITNAPIVVTDGYFLVTLDFGVGAFNGAARWLQIGVRTNGSVAAHTLLTPRQPVSTVPYAIQSLTASNVLGNINDSQLSGNVARLNSPASFAGTVTFNSGPNAPFRVVNPSLVTNLNADLLDGLDSTAFALSNHAHSASDITSGQLADARLSFNVPLLNRGQLFSGTNNFTSQVIATNASNVFAGLFSGNGASLSNLNALSLTGIVADAALPANVSRLASNQTFTGTALFSPSAGAPFRVGSATLVTNLNTDLLDGLNSTAFWNTAGNTNPGANLFLGTLDNTSLDLRANNQRALRLQPGTLAPNVIGGAAGNSVSAGVSGAVIGGGGPANSVTANYATVAGGTGNAASGSSSVVSGGSNNNATNTAATVPGGSGNLAGGANSFAAGQNAQALHPGTFVWADTSSLNNFTSTAPNTVILRSVGGVGINTNSPQSALHVSGTIQSDGLKLTASPQLGALLVSDAAGNATWQPAAVRALANATSPNIIGGFSNNAVGVGVVGATIAGGGSAGASNYVGGNFGTVGGGTDNNVNGNHSTIAGGYQNRANLDYSSVGGGYNNVANNFYATVAGGIQNTSGLYAAIGGGYLNNAPGTGAFVGGGTGGVASGQDSVVAGGNGNFATGLRSVVGGGLQNRASNTYSAILGGASNTNSGLAGTIGGGIGNAVTNSYATVPGGSGNVAGGQYSFAAGRNARATNDGTFVWGDNSTAAAFSSTAANQFVLRAAGGVGIGTGAPQNPLDVTSPGRVAGGVAGFNEVVAKLTNPTLGGHTAAAIDALSGQDAVLYFSENGSAVWGLRNDSSPEDQFQLRYQGTPSGPVYLAVNTNGAMRVGAVGFESQLALGGGLVLDSFNTNANNLAGGLRFGSSSGEGIASKRTSGTGQSNLVFYTRSTARMTIANDGSVGMGTDPLHPLTVIGTGTPAGGVAGQNDVVAAVLNASLLNSALSVWSLLGDSSIYLARGSGSSAIWGVRNNSGAGDQFQIRHEASGGAVALAVNPNGSIGIGTGSPTDRLTVSDGIRIDADDANTGTTANSVRFGGDSTGEAIGSQRAAGTGQYGVDIYTAGQIRTTVANNGNVGIGTRTPAARLDVQGSVRFGVNGTVMTRVQSGTFTAGGGSSGVNTYTLIFPAAFSGTPKVTITARGGNFSDTFALSTRSISTTAVTFNVFRVDQSGAAWAQNLQVDWMAWE